MTDATTAGAVAADAAPLAPSSTAGALAPSTGAGSTDTSTQAMMAQALVDGGHWTPEQAAAALAGDSPNGGPDEQESAENPFTAAVDQQNALADMKSTLAASGIEGADAMGAETIVRKGLANPPTPEQSAQAYQDTQQLMETLYGKEKAGWMTEWARREFQLLAAGNPKLVALAERSGAGNSMSLIQQLAYRGINRYNRARFGGK